MTDRTGTDSTQEVIRQSEEMIAEAEQMVDAMQRLHSKAGISREDCMRLLESEYVTSAQKAQIAEEMGVLKEELAAIETQSDETTGDDQSAGLKMGAGVLPV
jgi:hypothetical protein